MKLFRHAEMKYFYKCSHYKVLILLLQLPEPPVRGLRQVREQQGLREEGREATTEKRESIDGYYWTRPLWDLDHSCCKYYLRAEVIP